jgi:predicted Zn finger-like uncharacterized protein
LLTQCPNCGTIYQLGAADLSAAQGYVECGDCGTPFNALTRLADEPSFAPASTATLTPEIAETVSATEATAATRGPAIVLLDEDRADPPAPVAESIAALDDDAQVFADAAMSVAEPPLVQVDHATADSPILPESPLMFELDGETDPAPAPPGQLADDEPMIVGLAADAPIAATRPDSLPATDTMLADGEFPNAADVDEEIAGMVPLRPTTSVLTEADHAILFTDPDPDPDPDLEPEAGDAAEPFDLDDVPEIIRHEVAALAQPPRRRWRWFWVLLALLLSALALLQLAFTWRDEIVAAAPEIQPLFAAVCARFACAEPPREPSAIELVSRDVRDHPQYRDTLLVNATLVSRASGPVPFPVIQLGLQGPTGELIGVRRFAPSEYLDKSIDIAAGMRPNRAVYIVLEVVQRGDRAVSFEFSFL